jgi:hypothetical protein
MGLGIFDEHYPVNPAVDLTIADTTVPAYLTQAAQQASRIDDLVITSTAAGPHDVAIILDNGVARVLGVVAVPAGAGHSSAVPHVSASSLFPVPTVALILAGGTTLKVGMLVTLGAGEKVTVLAFGGDF